MALPILDGNQSATTLSTILSGGQHITAHTVVSLGTQAITDIVNATSAGLTNTQLRASAVTVGGTVTVGNSVTISSLPAISGTVTANLGNVAQSMPFGTTTTIPSSAVRIGWADEEHFYSAGCDAYGKPLPVQILLGNAIGDSVTTANPLPISGTVTVGNTVTIAGTVTANPTGTQTIAGTVTVGNTVNFISVADDDELTANISNAIQGSPLPAGTNRIGVVTIGAGTVTIGAGTAQIGSVTASISGTVPISISSVTVGNSVTISSLPALVAGTAQIGSVTASISNSVTIASLPAISGTVTANLAISSTAITSGSFASLTSATLVPGNVARKMATVYNLGAGQLFINAGATATTIGGGFMVALSSGDFYECDYTTTTLSAIFATAGTASWMSH